MSYETARRPPGLQSKSTELHAWWFADKLKPPGLPFLWNGSPFYLDMPLTTFQQDCASLQDMLDLNTSAENSGLIIESLLKPLQKDIEELKYKGILSAKERTFALLLRLCDVIAALFGGFAIFSQVRRKDKQYITVIEKHRKEFNRYGINLILVWRYPGPKDPQVKDDGKQYWDGPALVFHRVGISWDSQDNNTWQPGYQTNASNILSSPLQDVVNTDIAWKFVEYVTKKHDDLSNPSNASLIQTVSVDSMVSIAKRFIEFKVHLEQQGVNGKVSLGFHYTKPGNLCRIEQDGLHTWAEWGLNPPDRLAYGDGIYVSNNYTAFSKDYGNSGIMLAYIMGTSKCIQSKKDRNSLEMTYHTFIGNKKKTTTTNGSHFNDEIVLQRSCQCLPLFRFDKKILKRNQLISYQSWMQIAINKYFNKSDWYSSSAASAPGLSYAEETDERYKFMNDCKVKKLFRYYAPNSLTNINKQKLFSKVAWNSNDEDDDDVKVCPICFGDMKCEMNKQNQIVELNINGCHHCFHKHCIESSLKVSPKCPVCRKYVTEPVGQSPSGTLEITDSLSICSGFENESTRSFVLRYSMKGGKQKSYHPQPGKSYEGTIRVAYLPDDLNGDGRKLLKRLIYAFERGLTFMVGTSGTTNEDNVIVWSSVHHKTSLSGGLERHGYPDLSYFINCNEELDALGVPSDP